MKICIATRCFFPRLGGSIIVAHQLALYWQQQGHDVKLITDEFVPKNQHIATVPYECIRRPSWRHLRQLAKWADILVQHEIGISMSLPFLLAKKPYVAILHNWRGNHNFKAKIISKLQHLLAKKRGHVCAVSQAVAKQWQLKATIIPNFFDKELFFLDAHQVKDIDLCFAGRLIHDKGADLVLLAMQRILRINKQAKAVIIGEGPELTNLKKMAKKMAITSNSLKFVGHVNHQQVAAFYRRSKIICIPSRWEEPFGLAAVEGLATGAEVIATNSGGLVEALQGLGHIVENHASAAWLKKVVTVWQQYDNTACYQRMKQRADFLQEHTVTAIGNRYLHIFQQLLK